MYLHSRLLALWPLLFQLPQAWSTSTAAESDYKSTGSPLKTKPTVVQLYKATESLFHEGGVYHAPTKSLWVNSDRIESRNDTTRYIQRITGLDSPDDIKIDRIDHGIPHPIGGVRYIDYPDLGDVILFVAQGTKAEDSPGGIYALNPYPPYNSTLVLGSYGEYPYNSPDDLAVGPDGTIYFTDPPYGYGEGNREAPILPNQVYSYNPMTKDNRVVADGFGRPNGIATNTKGDKIYIGDTGASIGNGTTDLQGQRAMYVYDKQGSFLGNRRVFAMPDILNSAADGIKVDTKGNVWAGIFGKGVIVWDCDGKQLGSIDLKGEIGNIGFGEPGELFVLAGKRLYKILLSKDVVGAGP